MTLSQILKLNKQDCSCGKAHVSCVDDVLIGSGVISRLPEVVKGYNASRAFVLTDPNTHKAAGKAVCRLLCDADISVISYTIPSDTPKPDEKSVGSVIMHYDYSCDIVIAAGSGVINDIGKIVAATANKPYIIVATAPSVDGYASSTSSMDRDGLKISLNSKCANVIIGDTDILKNAPMKMLKAGLGDMLAKYTSIYEWRIGNIVTDEYYCDYCASLVRYATKRCVDNAEGLLLRDEKAVESVFEGLVIAGLAMNFAGVSRVASGVEHYFSHLWDMRALEFDTKAELHGLQCASGFISATRVYEKLKKITPNRQNALKAAQSFNVEEWNDVLRKHWGHGADTMISNGITEHRYDLENHAKRLDIIISRWNDILNIMDEELLPLADAENIFSSLDFPNVPNELSLDNELLALTFKATKDIRAKYILSTLLWDIGELDNKELLAVL